MSLTTSLQPLLALEGIIAVVVMTRDGLPVEMIGHGAKASAIAAQLSTVAKTAQQSFEALDMGTPRRLRVALEQHDTFIVGFNHHYLALITQPGIEDKKVNQALSNTQAKLNEALGGWL